MHVYYSSTMHVGNTLVLYITHLYILLTHVKGEREQFGNYENRVLAVSTTTYK